MLARRFEGSGEDSEQVANLHCAHLWLPSNAVLPAPIPHHFPGANLQLHSGGNTQMARWEDVKGQRSPGGTINGAPHQIYYFTRAGKLRFQVCP